MARYGHTIYGADRCAVKRSLFANFTRRGKTLYVHCHYWPGQCWSIGGLTTKVKKARLLATGKKVKFEQDRFGIRFRGLPKKAPDKPVTVLALECAGVPKQNYEMIRLKMPRASV